MFDWIHRTYQLHGTAKITCWSLLLRPTSMQKQSNDRFAERLTKLSEQTFIRSIGLGRSRSDSRNFTKSKSMATDFSSRLLQSCRKRGLTGCNHSVLGLKDVKRSHRSAEGTGNTPSFYKDCAGVQSCSAKMALE